MNLYNKTMIVLNILKIQIKQHTLVKNGKNEIYYANP